LRFEAVGKKGRGQRSPVKFAALHIFNIFNGAGKGRDRGQRTEGGAFSGVRFEV